MEQMHRIVNGKKVFLTEEEISEIQKEWNSKKTFKQYEQELTNLVQIMLDTKVKELWYDSMNEVVQFSVINNKWKQEADILLLWNAEIWELTEQHLGSSEENIPQDFEFINTLPKLKIQN